MADVKKIVVTEFRSEGLDELDEGIEAAASEVDELNRKIEKTGDKMEEAGNKGSASFGQTLDGISKFIPGLDKVAGGLKKAEQGAKQFGISTKAAIASTGIGLLVVAIGSLVSKFQEIGEKSENELSFTEKKFKDIGNAAKQVYDNVVNGITEWIQSNQKVFRQVFDFLNKISFGLAGKVAEFTAEIVNEAKAHEENKRRIQEEAEARKASIAAGERNIALLQAQGASAESIYQAQKRNLELKKEDAKTDEERYQIQTQLLVLSAQRKKRLEDERDALLRLMQEYNALIESEFIKKLQDDLNKLNNDFLSTNELAQRILSELKWDSADASRAAAQAMEEEVEVAEDFRETISAQELARIRQRIADKEWFAQNKQIYSELAIAGAAAVADSYGNELAMALVNAAGAVIKIWNSSAPFPVKSAQAAILAVTLRKQIQQIRKNRPPAAKGGSEGGEQAATTLFSGQGLTPERIRGEVSFSGTTNQQTVSTGIRNQRTVLVLEHLKTASHRLETVEKLSKGG